MDRLIKLTKTLDCDWMKVEDELKNGLLDKIIIELRSRAYELNNKKYKEVKNKWGIYLFQIKSECSYNFESLKKEWEEKAKNLGYRKFPKIYKGRFNELAIESTKVNEEYAFYLGKGEDLGGRIEQHICHELDNSTYGLKIKGRTQFENCLTYSFWELPIECTKENKAINQFIMTQLESSIRNRLHPLVGKQ